MGLGNALFGNADKLLPSLWDMVTYPFGGGTNKQDQAYYADQFAGLNSSRAVTQINSSGKVNLYGNYTGIGSVNTAKPLGQAIANNTIVPVAPVLDGAVKIALLGLGAILVIKLLK